MSESRPRLSAQTSGGTPPSSGPQPFAIAMICALGVGCVMFDQTSLVVAAPIIASEFGAGLSGLQWLTAMFALVAASTMPVSGMLGRRWGARTTLRLGLGILVVGGVVAATATSFPVLLVTRVVQGAGAALVLPNAATLLGGNIADPLVRARSVGHWMMTSSSALLLGPLISGLLAEHVGWRATFLVNLPFAVLAIVLVGRLRNTPREPSGRIDVAGLVLACGTLAVLAWSLIASGRSGTPWYWIVTGYVAALLLAAAFAVVERRVANPILDLDLFRSRTVRLLLIACFAYNAAINGTAILISVYFQDHRGFGSTAVGILILIANAGMPLAGLLVNLVRRRLDNLQLMTFGLFSLAVAYVALALGSTLHPATLVLPLMAIGLGAGVLYFVDTNTLLTHVQGPQSANAMAALALMRQIGSVLGIAAMASIGQIAVSAGVGSTGEPTAFLVSGVLLVVIALAAVRTRRHRRAART